MSWLPTYLKNHLNLPLEDIGFFGFFPNILYPVLLILSGYLADKLINKGFSRIIVRKVFQSIGNLGPGLCVLLLGILYLDNTSVLVLLTLGVGSMGVIGGGVEPLPLDISRKYSGALYGVTNTIAQIPGIIGVYLTGFILEQTDEKWDTVFILAAAVFGLAEIVFIIFAESKEIDFEARNRMVCRVCCGKNDIDDDESPLLPKKGKGESDFS